MPHRDRRGVQAEAAAAADAAVAVQDLGVDGLAQGRADGAACGGAGHGAQHGAGYGAEREACGPRWRAQQGPELSAKLCAASHSRHGGRRTGDGADGTANAPPQVAGDDAMGVAVGAAQAILGKSAATDVVSILIATMPAGQESGIGTLAVRVIVVVPWGLPAGIGGTPHASASWREGRWVEGRRLVGSRLAQAFFCENRVDVAHQHQREKNACQVGDGTGCEGLQGRGGLDHMRLLGCSRGLPGFTTDEANSEKPVQAGACAGSRRGYVIEIFWNGLYWTVNRSGFRLL